MSYQSTFKRHEIKYLLDGYGMEYIMSAMKAHTVPDAFAEATVRNIYFDTDSYRLIRRSLERPAYKEKLRVRSYGAVGENDSVFVELKKKYRSVVYKRRMTMPYAEAMRALEYGMPPEYGTQIASEIEYFRLYYETLRPRMVITYDRCAFASADGDGVRITFDKNILYRNTGLSLCDGIFGRALLPTGMTLMEIKTPSAVPLWLVGALSSLKVYKTSFSKYGMAYTELQLNKMNGEKCYV